MIKFSSKNKKTFYGVTLLTFFLFTYHALVAQSKHFNGDSVKAKSSKVLFGTASFYSDKFEGRKTANGEIFSQKKLTAACNVLPLGTWLRITNLRNGKQVVVKTNDRLHPKMTRIVDLTKAAAIKLNFVSAGLTKVKVEVLGKKKLE